METSRRKVNFVLTKSLQTRAHSLIKTLERRDRIHNNTLKNEQEKKNAVETARLQFFCRWLQCYNRHHAVSYPGYRVRQAFHEGLRLKKVRWHELKTASE